MKTITTFIAIAFLSTIVKAQNVNIPDANFKAALLAHGTSITGTGIIDTDDDGEISIAEAAAYTGSIIVYNQGISDLTGIEAFTAATELYCSNNQLTSLDVSQCTALERLYCMSNQLTSLDVSQCTALERLRCYDNQLTSLDVSQCTALERLRCYDNQLASLNVTQNTVLTHLYCYKNQLTSLDVSQNTGLLYFDCFNNQLTSLDVSQCTALANLSCHDNQLTNLTFGVNTALNRVDCFNNQLTNLNVGQCTALKKLFCYNNQITSLDVSNNTALRDLYCSTNNLNTLDVSVNEVLDVVDCQNNPQLVSLNVANGDNLFGLGIVSATNCPNLTCIQHDVGYDPTSNGSWTKDDSAIWSDNCATASTNDVSFKGLTIYPNPAEDVLYITAQENINQAQLISISGKVIKTFTKDTTMLNISDVATGIYLLKLKNNEKQTVRKIVVK